MSAEDWTDICDDDFDDAILGRWRRWKGLGLAPIKREGSFLDYESGKRGAPVCYKHPSYKGLKKPRAKCAACAEMFAYHSLTTVGVKFLDFCPGQKPGKVYTYLIQRDHGVTPGDELVVDTQRGPALVLVTRVDTKRQDNGPYQYKQVRGRVVPL